MKLLKDCILAQVGEAKGHEINGVPEFADAKSLKLFADGIETDLPVSIDHKKSLLSPLVGIIARVIKGTQKVIGDKLFADVELNDAAFTDAKLNVGKHISDAYMNNKTGAMLSLETNTAYKMTDDKALLRPDDVTGCSFVLDGALTDQLCMSAEYKAFEAKYSKSEINNNNGEKVMTEEVKKVEKVEEVKPNTEAVKVELAADDKAKDKEVPASVTPAPVNPEVKSYASGDMGDVHTKLDAILAMLTKLDAKNGADDAKAAVKMDDDAVTDGDGMMASKEHAAKEPAKKVIEVKFKEDIKVAAEFSASEDEMLEKAAKDPKYLAAHKAKVFAALDKRKKV